MNQSNLAMQMTLHAGGYAFVAAITPFPVSIGAAAVFGANLALIKEPINYFGRQVFELDRSWDWADFFSIARLRAHATAQLANLIAVSIISITLAAAFTSCLGLPMTFYVGFKLTAWGLLILSIGEIILSALKTRDRFAL